MTSKLDEARKKFFREFNWGFRFPGCFFLVGDHAVEFGQPALLVAVDFSVWVGIRKIPSDEIILDLRHANPASPLHDQSDINPDVHYFGLKETNPFLTDRLNALKNGIRALKDFYKIQEGLAVSIWSDIPFSVGLSAGAAVASGISACLISISRDGNQTSVSIELEKFRRMRGWTLSASDGLLSQLFESARWLDSFFSPHFRIGAQVLTSILGTRSSDPFMFFLSEKTAPKQLDQDKVVSTSDFRRFRNQIRSNQYIRAVRIAKADLFNGLGVSLVYCGKLGDPVTYFSAIRSNLAQDLSISAKIVRAGISIGSADVSRLSYPLREIIAAKTTRKADWLEEVHCSAIGTMTLQMLAIFNQPGREISSFGNLLVRYGRLLKNIGLQGDDLVDLRRALRGDNVPTHLKAKTWTKAIGFATGGDIAVFGDMNVIREFNRFVADNREWTPRMEVQLHATSARDGEIVPRTQFALWTREADFCDRSCEITADASRAYGPRLNVDRPYLKFEFNDVNNRIKISYRSDEIEKLNTRARLLLLLLAIRGLRGSHTVDVEECGCSKDEWYKTTSLIRTTVGRSSAKHHSVPQTILRKVGVGAIELDLDPSQIQVSLHSSQLKHERPSAATTTPLWNCVLAGLQFLEEKNKGKEEGQPSFDVDLAKAGETSQNAAELYGSPDSDFSTAREDSQS